MPKTTLALNFQLTPDESGAAELPTWLPLVPAGRIAGRDGRGWINDQPEAVIQYNRSLNRDIAIDIEHASELKAPLGDPAPAAGWLPVADLAVRDGAVWGRVEWNETGRGLVANREYRYYSPAVLYDNTRRIRGIASIGLTNKPNLDLPALNRQQTPDLDLEDAMLPEAIRKALGLDDNADEAQAVTAIHTLNSDRQVALNQQGRPPALEQYVPRADYDQLATEKSALQTALNQERQDQREAEITALVDSAIKAGKITPATKEFYLSTCRQEGGIEHFQQFLEKAPAVTADDTGLDGRRADESHTALNREVQELGTVFGNTAADFQQYGQ